LYYRSTTPEAAQTARPDGLKDWTHQIIALPAQKRHKGARYEMDLQLDRHTPTLGENLRSNNKHRCQQNDRQSLHRDIGLPVEQPTKFDLVINLVVSKKEAEID
jgi:hypothetical protein